MSESPEFPLDEPLAPKKRAIIIGASSGIGAALAKRLAREGYLLALLARREEMLEALCDEINAEAGEKRAVAYVHDVTDTGEAPELFQKLLKDMRRIDLVAYVAGITTPVDISEFDFEKESGMVATNLLGAMAWLGQAATLFERMKGGQIVGVSSVAGDRGRVRNPGYHASKAGLDAYLESLRNRLTRHGVRVLTVKPGFVDTEQLKASKRTFGVISPEKAARDIWRGIRKRKQLIYTPWWWRWIMLIVIRVPSFIFRRLSF